MADEVLIVIPCLNEAANLPALLGQLLAETEGQRIVVADGGSTDGSRRIVREIAAKDDRVILLNNPARLQSAGVNLAVETHGAEAAWLVRVDAHCKYPRDYVARLVEAAAARHARAVVVPMISRGFSPFQIAAATAQNSRLGTGGSPHRHRGRGAYVDHGHHALMDMALFRRVGGYREDMAHNEDAELDQRLAKAGARIWLEPELALVYLPRSTVGGLWHQYWGYGQGRARTLQLHRKRPKLRQALPLAVPVAGGLALFAPVHPIFALPLAGWALLCLGGGALIGARAHNRYAMASGAAAMTMHMAWGLGFLKQVVLRRR